MFRLVPSCVPICVVVLIAAGCGDNLKGGEIEPGPDAGADDYIWNLPPGFPKPKVPADNPMSEVKVQLGRHLFFDTKLSGNETQACGSCHDQSLAFSENQPVSIGSTGELTPRNSMGLANAAYNSTYTWVNPNLGALESQIPIPMFGELPTELGLMGLEGQLFDKLRGDPIYPPLFAAAYPDEADPYTTRNIVFALASFVRTMISGTSPYDRFIYLDDEDAISESAERGADLFFTEKVECFHCHGTFNFSVATTWEGQEFLENGFFNTGLYDVDGNGSYPPENPGLVEFTGMRRDDGKFRAQSLRNIRLTAPYLHDGSAETLEDVIDIYASGGRNITDGPYVGDGRLNIKKDGFVRGFILTPQERADLIAFLDSLTDEAFLTDPQFSNPFEE